MTVKNNNLVIKTEELLQEYSSIKEKSLKSKHFKHEDIKKLVKKISENKMFNVQVAGKSIENRDIYLIKAGTGKKKIVLWSQMHGNEPTATAAIFDILNFFSTQNTITEDILKENQLFFIPMLNPDGAERFIRKNAIGIDINRDASRVAAPESKILINILKKHKPNLAFNLHDQEKYYTVGNSKVPASISFLAPAYNTNQDINNNRLISMQIIAEITQILQNQYGKRIAKYSSEFYPSAFGDNIQKMGIPTILIESGGFENDPEKQKVREMNFVAIINAFISLTQSSFKNFTANDYNKIPMNGKFLFDLLIKNLLYKNIQIDIGIKHIEEYNSIKKETTIIGKIEEIGDLSRFYGYKEFDAKFAKIEVLNELLNTKQANFTIKGKNLNKKVINGFLE